MILFRDDWKRFPNAMEHYSTSNASFLRMASVYEQMGIENNLFHLTLLQPELEFVDPHSETLTEEQKAMIAVECKYNPWYFLREVVRIPPNAGNRPIPYRANRGNLALTWLYLCSIDVMLIQPRQTGKSVSTDCLMIWLLFFGTTNNKISLITKDNKLRTENIGRLKKIRDLLPPYLWVDDKNDANNQIMITYNSLNNKYNTAVAQASETAANNVGRGFTQPTLHFDEVPFIRFIRWTLPAAMSSGNAARDEARLNGQHYGTIFTTTAGKIDDEDGKFVYDMMEDGVVWDEHYMDSVGREDLRSVLRKNCRGRAILVNATFSHRQLGYSDEWLRDKMAESRSTGDVADRDYFNRWTSGTQSSPLSPKLNEIIRNSELDPLHLEIMRDGYALRWFISERDIDERMASGHYILGMDSSDAIGRDGIGFVLTDVTDLSTVAAGTFNETNILNFAMFVASFLTRFENVTFVIERKSSGQSIIDALLLLLPKAGIDPFKRIYNSIVNDANANPVEYEALNRTPMSRRDQHFYDSRKKTFGFNTTGSSRERLYSTVLQNAAKNAGHLVRDRKLSGEIRGLVVKNGRIDHSVKGHDDMVISWLLTHWLLSDGLNLHHYGIPRDQVMVKVSGETKTLNPTEQREKLKQKQLRKELDFVYERLKTTRDQFAVAKLEHQMKSIADQIEDTEEENLSFDALMQQIKEERSNEKRIGAAFQRSTQPRHASAHRSSPWMRQRPGGFQTRQSYY